MNWTPRIKGYKQATGDGSPINWGVDTTPFLQIIKATITTSDYFNKLALLWGQEPSKTSSTVELRSENVLYIKSLGTVFPTQNDENLLIFEVAKTFEVDGLDTLLEVIDPLLSDSDKFKQRAGGELISYNRT